jgi:prepilin-type N-terminal cleavage/methylation domain-containing protein
MIGTNKKGFTLIELIVAIALLLAILGTAIGIFVSIVQHQRIILAEQELLNQVSYVLEYMSKALRMAGKDLTGDCLKDNFGTMYPGYNYLLTRPVNGVYTGIKFINRSDNDTCQEFYLDNTDPENSVLKETKNGLPVTGVALTSDKFMINFIRFGINGNNGLTTGIIGAAGDNSIQPEQLFI